MTLKKILKKQLRAFPSVFLVWKRFRYGCVSTKAYKRRIDRFFLNPEKSINSFRTKKRAANLILSFTSFPARIGYVEYTLFSVLNQTIRPEKIILWLSEEEFPGKEADIPDSLKKYQPFNFEIQFVKKNLKSYTKLYYALREFPDYAIVVFDDDVYYKPRWLEKLYNAYLENPGCMIAHRIHTISFNNKRIDSYQNWKRQKAAASPLNFFTGVGGVLYPPRSLYKDVYNHELFLTLCPNADDIWFYVMALLQGTKIQGVRNGYSRAFDFDYIFSGEYMAIPKLADINVAKNQNDVQLKNVLEYYHMYDSFYQTYGENQG
ncbi:MAG: glycosyltransferase family 2 protein [Spirochaetaceae bacterium]|jgi:hypothetical protein|nr:glycosyltransferase family 2 protein [Spirochaetaceae bacterium]